jgi:hypothetical protein
LIANDELVWRPVHFVAAWQGSNLTHRVSVVLALPGGAATSSKDVTLKVEDDGHTLVATTKWPDLVGNVAKLHKKFGEKENLTTNEMTDLALRKFGLEKALSNMRENMDDKMKSVARIPLKMRVEEKIHNMELIGDEFGARVVYVDLKAPDSNYEGKAEKKFEMV